MAADNGRKQQAGCGEQRVSYPGISNPETRVFSCSFVPLQQAYYIQASIGQTEVSERLKNGLTYVVRRVRI
jgi:hypothetical protein